jgi:hypothetical protein
MMTLNQAAMMTTWRMLSPLRMRGCKFSTLNHVHADSAI